MNAELLLNMQAPATSVVHGISNHDSESEINYASCQVLKAYTFGLQDWVFMFDNIP